MRFSGSRATIGLLLTAVVAAGVAACGENTADRQEPAKASYEAAPCPRPNYPGVPAADLGPNYTCGYLPSPRTGANPSAGRSGSWWLG
jgi:uncharacterized lipoprotein